MTLQELLKALQEERATMRSLHAKCKTETDPTKLEAFTAAFDESKGKADNLMAQVNQAKAMQAMDDSISELEEGEEADAQGKAIPNPVPRTPEPIKGKVHPADALFAKTIEVQTNEMKDEYLRRHHFFQYMHSAGKSLTEEGYNCLSPESRRLEKVSNVTQGAVMIPRSVVYNMFPEVAFNGKSIFLDNPLGKSMLEMGKTMLSTDSTGQSTDSGTAFTIAPDFRATVQQQPVYMPMIIDKCQMAPAVNGKAIWPKLDQGQGNFGGVAFTWKAAEGLDKGETEPVFGEFEVDTHELSGWTAMSLRALRRSTVQLEAFLTTLFRNACRYEWSKQVVNGTGVNKPYGIVPFSGVNEVNRLTANQVVYKDLVNLEYAISKGNRNGGMYLIEDSVEQYLVGQLDGDNRPLFQNSVAGGRGDRLNNYGYECHEFTPDLGTEGDVIFGNFLNYIFGVEEDIAIARSDHAEFKKGLVVFRLICYVGGKPLHPGAFSRLTDAA